MEIIVRGRHDHLGKTRSEQEGNLRKEWGRTMSDEQLDKLKFLERQKRAQSGSRKNFITGNEIDRVK